MKSKIGSMAALLVMMFAFSSQAGVPEGNLLEGVSPGPDGRIDVLNIMSHPDDESVYAGGTLIKLKKDPRVRLHLVCMTNGDMSDARFFMRVSRAEMARIRTEELKAAGRALGADEVIQLAYHDQGLKSADQKALVAELVEIMERTGAEVVITQDPGGVTHHPDHVTCSRVATQAFKKSSASRLYYATLPTGRYIFTAITSPFHEPGPRAQPTLKVDISAEREQRNQAISAHGSQIKHSLVGLSAPQFYSSNTEYFALAETKQ